MISRNLYLNIIFRVLLITAAALFTAWSVTGRKPFLLPASGILVIVTITVNLIWYLNSTNRKVAYFFDSVRNDDSSLSFPVDGGSKTIREITSGLNSINNKIGWLRIESRKQEIYFQALLEHAATGIVAFNRSGHVLHANSAARRLLSVEVLSHLKQLERVDIKTYQVIQNLMPPGQKLVAVNRENGMRQLLMKTTAFHTGKEELTILSIQDIKQELDEKELESWIRIIRVMMHEIINSIAPITSLSESLEKLYTAGDKPVSPADITSETIDKTLQGMRVIRQQGNGLLSFIESYRKLTKLPPPAKKIISMDDLLSRLSILYKSYESTMKAALHVSCTPEDLEVLADETQLSLCLINLVKNAMEANESNPEGVITVEATISNGHPVIIVTDNGPGISPEIINEIFVPFFTTKENGSGIGLSISQQIMRLHGGSLRVKSVPGETSFVLTL